MRNGEFTTIVLLIAIGVAAIAYAAAWYDCDDRGGALVVSGAWYQCVERVP